MTEKLEILEKIEKGEISPSEGVDLLSDIGNGRDVDLSKENEMQILDLIEKGDISIEEGLQKLHGTKEQHHSVTMSYETKDQDVDENHNIRETTPISDADLQKWRNWWTIPVFLGFILVILSALWMNTSYENAGVNFWFIFSWIPLLLGIATMALSWPSPNRTWVHVRVKQANGASPEKIAISIPAPLKIISWGLRIAKRYAPDEALQKLDETAVDELLMSLESNATKGTPFYVVVDEGDNGEKVEVYIG